MSDKEEYVSGRLSLIKRAVLSVAGGLGTMLVIIACMTISNRQSRLESVFFWMLAFPVFLFDPLFPPHSKPPDDLFLGFPSPEAIWATLIFDLLFYSLLVYLVLWRRGRIGNGRSPSRYRIPVTR